MTYTNYEKFIKIPFKKCFSTFIESKQDVLFKCLKTAPTPSYPVCNMLDTDYLQWA